MGVANRSLLVARAYLGMGSCLQSEDEVSDSAELPAATVPAGGMG